MNGLEQLAEFLVKLEFSEIPEDVKRAAADCVTDTVSAALGAWERELLTQVEQLYQPVTAGCRQPVAVWGREGRADLLTAVMLNGMAAHSLELDDVHTKSKTHIGAVVIPAAWGMAEYLGKTADDFLLSVICGYEAMARIGMSFGVSSHRNKGWHATATAGTFGAAAACGKLAGLSLAEMVSALGLAGTQSFGVWAFLSDGANCKILHTGRAAVTGLESALLAKAGMTGAAHILDAEDGGLFHAMTEQPEAERVNEELGGKWEILQVDRKPYPCCRSTHCAADAALLLRKKMSVKPEDILTIRVSTYLVGNKQCGMSDGSKHPAHAVDAKFSTPFVTACALLFGEVTERYFTEEYLKDKRIKALLEKVTVVTDDSFTRKYPEHWGCRMEVRTVQGEIMEQTIEDASGSVQKPLTETQLRDKAVGALEPVFHEEAEGIWRLLATVSGASPLPVLVKGVGRC